MNGPRFNEFISVPKVRVIDENGENLGVMFTREAIEQAAEVGLDLVEVSPNADPPVCKFLDVGKFKYEAQKKANIARKTQKTQEIKEIKMRPNIDDHDYDVKMRSIHKFIGEGDKVKVTCASAAASLLMASSACSSCSASRAIPARWRKSNSIRAWKAGRC
jgi:translation initiation factor IF-3